MLGARNSLRRDQWRMSAWNAVCEFADEPRTNAFGEMFAEQIHADPPFKRRGPRERNLDCCCRQSADMILQAQEVCRF